MGLLVHGGTVVNATGTAQADVLVEGERIVAVTSPGLFDPAEHRSIDATGKYVIPGGVDAHVHLNLPVGDLYSADDFASGTEAAAWGGTTTVIDFAQQLAGEIVEEQLELRHAEAAGQCAIDYGFHLVLGGVDDAALAATRRIVEHEGITSLKLFMAYPGRLYSDDGQILRAMQTAGELGAMVMMHAENGIAIDVLVRQALEAGRTDPAVHSLTRPVELEAEATHRAIMLARVARCPLYVVHMSAEEAVAEVVAARDRGWNVFGETCPQYLYLSLEEHLSRSGLEGAAYVCSTPLRARAEGHQDALWRFLRTDDLQVVSTDHCPFCLKDGKDRGLGDFSKIPNGIGGIEHRVDLMYQGVVTGELSLERWVDVCATTPARLFGLAPRKGVIQPGADGDLVVYDPAGRTVLGAATHHMRLDHSAFEGIEIAGRVDTVVSRGSVVVQHGQWHGRAGHGQFVKRGVPGLLR